MKRYRLRNGMVVVVREAEENDAAAIKDVVNRVASEKYYIVPDRSREDWDNAIREIKDRESLIVAAEVCEKIVGMAHLVRGKFEKNKHVGFLGVSILKEFRGIGVGTAMMDYMMEWADRQRGLEKISLSVLSTNTTAMNLYRKLGFEIEGRNKRQFKIEDKYVDEIIMGKFLT